MNLSKFVLIIIMFIFLITLLILVTSASWGGLLTGQEPCISNNEQAVYSVKSYGTKGYMKVGLSDTDIEISEPYATDSWKIKSNIEHHFEIDDKIYAGVVSNTNSTPPLINHDNCLSKNETSSHKKYSERKNEYTDSITEEITIFNANLDYKTSSFFPAPLYE